MFIFGGTNFIEEFSTMYIINLNTMICRTIDTKNDGMPYAVDSHTAILWEKDDAAEMIIFGGFVDGLRSNQLFSCDLTTLKWE